MKKRIILGLQLLLIAALTLGIFQAGKFLLPRYQLDKIGYSKLEIEQIMTLPKEKQDIILDMVHLENISVWLEHSENFERYSAYNSYQGFYPDLEAAKVVETVNMIEDHPDIFVFSSNQDRSCFYTHASTERIAEYLNQAKAEEMIENPESETVLISEDAQLSISYEPEDLQPCVLENAEDANVTAYMAADANQALKEMAEDAQKAGYVLMNNSSYRSYFDQEEIYQYYLELYGEAYCDQYVAKPGYSEHQTGLAIDLTCQAVQDGTYYVFGDSPDYDWVMEHGHEYGFIRRYPEEKSELTGVANEPWHFRYVGKEAAGIIYENDWVLEEYVRSLDQQ